MTKISNIFILMICTLFLLGCEDTYTPDLNYVTFEVDPSTITVIKNESASTDVSVFTTTIEGSDRTFDIVVSENTTINATAYDVPTTVTVPANSNEGIFSVTFSDNDLAEEGALVLDLDTEGVDILKGGSLTLNVTKYCPLENIEVLVGTFAVAADASGYETALTSIKNDDTSLTVDGFGAGMITNFWGEPIVDGGTCVMNVNFEAGTVSIPRQYIFTTTYDGAEYTYEIEGSGTWNVCSDKPSLNLSYDIYYTGEEIGLGEQYSSYFTYGYLGGIYILE